MSVVMTPVESTAIKAAGYDAANEELHLEFHSGHRHAYAGVSSEKYKAFMASDSKGRYFHAHIRNDHVSRRHTEK